MEPHLRSGTRKTWPRGSRDSQLTNRSLEKRNRGRTMFSKIWGALFVLLCLCGPASADDLLVGSYKLDSGEIHITRGSDNLYGLYVKVAGGKSSRVPLEARELHDLSSAVRDAKNLGPSLPPKTLETVWGLETSDWEIWVTAVSDEKFGPLVVISYYKGDDEVVGAVAKLRSPNLEKLEKFAASVASRDMQIDRPRDISIKGNYVQHTWKNGRPYISVNDARNFLNYSTSSSGPVDLLQAAEDEGYVLAWSGGNLDFRKSFSGTVFSGPTSGSSSGYYYSSGGGATTGSRATSKGAGSGGTVHVGGYYRKDGTYVKPHTRSAPTRR